MHPLRVSSNTRQSISFAGCGALNFYQVGVAQALSESMVLRDATLLGASAGAGLAVLLSAGYDPYSIVRRMVNLVENAVGPSRFLGPEGVQAVGEAFTDEFLQPDTFRDVSHRVGLSITRLRPFGNIRASHFESHQDLVDALRAACFIPSRRRPAARYRGQWCIDGGLTDNEPILDKHTFRISPLWTSIRADIRPSPLHVGLNEMVRLPSRVRSWSLFDRGLRDGRLRLLSRRGTALLTTS
ncbi:MAG: patatin-like phospholipase family protein [Myxococcota bacterium]|nr:patatin-like phospholipase family protein [Myxococcota bacterium]